MERKKRDDMKLVDEQRLINIIKENIKPEKVDEAVALTNKIVQSFRPLHDRLITFCGYLFAYIAHNFGEDRMEEVNREICTPMFRDAPDSWANIMKKMTPEEMARFIVENSWSPHGFVFDVFEDDEKFDLVAYKCTAQGVPEGTLLTAEWTTRKAYSWSQNKKGFPYACVHASYLNWISEEARIPFRIVPPIYNDDGTPTGDPTCHYIIYKNLEYMPKGLPMPPEYKKLS